MKQPILALLLLLALAVEGWILWQGHTRQGENISPEGATTEEGSGESKHGPPGQSSSPNNEASGHIIGGTTPSDDSGNPASQNSSDEFALELKRRVAADPFEWVTQARALAKITDGPTRALYAHALVRALNFIDTEKLAAALPPVTEALQNLSSATPEIRQVWAAASLIYNSSDMREEVIRLAAADPDVTTRAFLIDVIGDYGADPRVDRIVEDAASGASFEARLAAIDSLAKVGGANAINLLETAAVDTNFQLRQQAWDSLCYRAKVDDRALDAVRKICASEMSRDDAKLLMVKIDSAKLLSRLSREDMARLESKIHER